MIKDFITKLFWNNISFWLCLSILILLISRNPFSNRTLIANLDPFPDSIHYLDPALNLMSGKGFVVERLGNSMPPDVPPLYSVILSPFLALFNDTRAFYFANVSLLLTAYTLFYLLVKQYFSKNRIRFFTLFLFATSLTLTWYPTVAMAENLILTLFLAALVMLKQKNSFINVSLMSILSISFYATKYASLPLTVAFVFLFLFKLFLSHKEKKISFNKIVFFLFCTAFIGLSFEVFEYFTKGTNVSSQLFLIFNKVFISKPLSSTNTTNVFFSTEFITQNIRAYGSWLLGKTLFILWRPTQILPVYLSLIGVSGVILGLFHAKTRYLSFSLITTILATITFLMTFYSIDGRYLYTAFPTLFLGVGIFLTYLDTNYRRGKFSGLVALLPFFLFLLFFVQQALPLKQAVSLNLRHAEIPWMYVSITLLDEYLGSQSFTQTPFIITPLPPHVFDYYLKNKVALLPLTTTQDFRSKLNKVWGEYDFSNLILLYRHQLEIKRQVFIATYGLGRDDNLHQAFDLIKNEFELTKVKEGCYSQCDIYELHLKTEPSK